MSGSILLTVAITQDYSSHTTAKSVVGFDSLIWSGEEPQASCSAAFLLPRCARFMGGLSGEPQGSPVLHRSVNPFSSAHPFDRGERFVQRTGAHIMTTLSQKPSVKLIDGKPTTTSLQVAKFFRKEHYRVLRAIKNLNCSPEFSAANFGVVEYVDAKGEKRQEYTITKDGFMFLAMGFTGKEAAIWKEKFIEAFNALERRVIEKLKTGRAIKALPQQSENLPKRYNYPRKLLEQPYFSSEKCPAGLEISMLTNTKKFISPLFGLLNELRADGHDVSAPLAEAEAMREGLIRAHDAFNEIWRTAIGAQHAESSAMLGNSHARGEKS